MDHQIIELLIIAAAVALVAHIVVRKYGWACLVTVLIAPVIYGVESIIRLHLPPSKAVWLMMIWPVLAILSLSAATAVGLPFLAWRRFARRRGSNREVSGTPDR